MARASLKAADYDLIVDSQGLLKSALWTGAARGLRCGYDAASAREPIAARFYDRCYAVAREMHAIERNRRLLAQAIGYELDDLRPDYGLSGLAARLPVQVEALVADRIAGGVPALVAHQGAAFGELLIALLDRAALAEQRHHFAALHALG